jgi:hypothetical protein
MTNQYHLDSTDSVPESCYTAFKTEDEYITMKRKEAIARFAGKLLIDTPTLKITLRKPTVLV